MSNALRNEVGALGFVRQNGLQRERSSFRGVGGRPTGLNSAPLPNHAPQRVSPRPWGGRVENAAAFGAPGATASVPPAAAPSVRAADPAFPTGVPPVGSRSLGSFLRTPAAPSPSAAERGAPLELVPEAREEGATTLAALAGFTPDAELREDIAACKSRLDATGLRLSCQDNVVKSLERSVSALREEYSKVSQATDAQSVVRLETCERALGRLDAGFQDFSSRFQRELQAVEQSFAEGGAHAPSAPAALPRDETTTPIPCKLLQDEPDGLMALETLHLYLPLHEDATGAPCLYRKRFSPALGALTSTSFRVQERGGEPRVFFV